MRGVSLPFSILNSQFSILNSAAAFALLLGHFLPWATHAVAPLMRSGHDLSISTNFTPGAGIFLNEWFLLPLWSAAVLLALLSGVAPWPRRAFGGAFALLVASLGLPAYPHILTAHVNPDYRLQFFITLGVFALIIAILLAGSLRPWMRMACFIACAIASAVPLIGYFAVKPAVEALYRSPVGVGLGWWFTLAGVVLLLAPAGAKILRRFTPKRAVQSPVAADAGLH
ncbi:MAG: hypothetical protein RMN52_01865 [Anaerolineae bacterium]|nr:hypothetical protein [Candidatus Roseilinea sp.]MDW8448726.1 hypothetical protein [Anaerolineae bacterium]